jgi:hypothetical protein
MLDVRYHRIACGDGDGGDGVTTIGVEEHLLIFDRLTYQCWRIDCSDRYCSQDLSLVVVPTHSMCHITLLVSDGHISFAAQSIEAVVIAISHRCTYVDNNLKVSDILLFCHDNLLQRMLTMGGLLTYSHASKAHKHTRQIDEQRDG